MRFIAENLKFLFPVLLLCHPGIPAASEDADLYRATTFVTGEREETRIPSIQDTFRQVLVKVSGTSSLLKVSNLEDEIDKAGDYVAGYSYRDRMEGIPHHDEQGSRDRPFDLTVHFDPEKIDAIISKFGFHKWQLPRPRILSLVKVEFKGSGFFLANDTDKGIGQREALMAEADKLGLEVALPDIAKLEEVKMENLSSTTLNEFAEYLGGDIALRGVLTWDDSYLHWKSRWQMRVAGQDNQWEGTEETFDSSFRAALGTVAEILSQSR
ncbi:hypothetical protein SAMN04515647_3427 [Cohaesibacter sp. ES.047]|uniref:DUF2066 domain-containing protein n=1 Tax=Cohaesibacter sp. ES.047 TaxID=1798205 RepID=UPI000BB679FE|nr:DUF2066 domain-containing protein [Cohaesibacter sp. ES.047]SNY93145.1 hypothetical protein SAMN04515647_3427 [Cohaesibacter sp. ES.047]